MAKIQLTNEEKIVKKYYEEFVSKRRITSISKKEVIEFCNNYVKEVLKNTRFENEVLEIKDETSKGVAGSMATAENGKVSILKINFEEVVGKNGFKSRNKDAKFKTFVELLDTLNHETQHYFQTKEIQNFRITANGMKLSTGMEIVRENIASAVERDKFYSLEEGNYSDLYIEGDARRNGAIKTSTQLLRIFSKLERSRKETLINRVVNSIERDNVEFNKLKYDGSTQKYDRGDVTSAYVDEYIAYKPESLERKKYSVLAFEYGEDGSRYYFDEVLNIRDDIYETIKNNKKITSETRKNMYEQVDSGFSQILYNSLIRSSKETIVDIRRRIGDKRFIKELDYIHEGKKKEIAEKVQKYRQYDEFFMKNRDKLSQRGFSKIEERLNKLYANTKYVIKKDELTGEEYDTIESDQIKFLQKLGAKIIETKGKYPMFTPEEIEENDLKRKEQKEKYKEQMKREFEQRKFEQCKKREARERAIKEFNRREHARKMKNPIYRFAYNIRKAMENSKRKKLPQGVAQNKYLEEDLVQKRDELNHLTNSKDNLEIKYTGIQKEAEELIVEAESKAYLDKQEVRENEKNINEEEQNIGKGNI